MAGSDAHHDAHLEVGPHGFALFLAPDAEYPVIDVDGTLEQLDAVVRDLQAALAARRAPSTDTPDSTQRKLTRRPPSDKSRA